MQRRRFGLIIVFAAIAIAAAGCGKNREFSLTGGDSSVRQTGSWDWLDRQHHP
jgi:hypothetical protein